MMSQQNNNLVYEQNYSLFRQFFNGCLGKTNNGIHCYFYALAIEMNQMYSHLEEKLIVCRLASRVGRMENICQISIFFLYYILYLYIVYLEIHFLSLFLFNSNVFAIEVKQLTFICFFFSLYLYCLWFDFIYSFSVRRYLHQALFLSYQRIQSWRHIIHLNQLHIQRVS